MVGINLTYLFICVITVFSLFQNSRCFIYITHLEYQHDESLLLNYKFLASNLTSIPIIQNFNYLEKEKVQKSLRILSKFTDNKQINIIFYLLAVEELCVCDIACLLNLSMASASHHLRKLANQNILDTRREGKIIYYFIKDEEIRDFFNQLG
ncbi:transcriptional regulator [Streptococcus suis]|nr:transcriptional regulator [Streptococcus suis]RRR44039.1 transcriptional regulator [Streptococcus suis]